MALTSLASLAVRSRIPTKPPRSCAMVLRAWVTLRDGGPLAQIVHAAYLGNPAEPISVTFAKGSGP
jgi:hypothetical protein